MSTLIALLGPALSGRLEISSLPEAVAVTVNNWVAVPAAIVIRKSMYPAPLIVFDAEAFAVTPATSPANAAVTVNANADVAGLDNATRTTNVVPATYIPVPVNQERLWIDNAACALMLTLNALLGPALSVRFVISSLPVTVAVMLTDCVVTAAETVTLKSI